MAGTVSWESKIARPMGGLPRESFPQQTIELVTNEAQVYLSQVVAPNLMLSCPCMARSPRLVLPCPEVAHPPLLLQAALERRLGERVTSESSTDGSRAELNDDDVVVGANRRGRPVGRGDGTLRRVGVRRTVVPLTLGWRGADAGDAPMSQRRPRA